MRAFIFDLDGTLLDTLLDIGNACNAMLAAHGYPVHPPEAYRQMVGNGFGKLVRRALPADALERLRTQRPDEQAVEALVHETRTIYAAHLNDATRPYAGMPDALRELSGREHEVVTAVTIRSTEREETFSDVAKVRFSALEDTEIDYYIDRYRPYDKAGAYGIQEWIGYACIEGIEGSFYTIMGLPVQKVYARLKTFLDER